LDKNIKSIKNINDISFFKGTNYFYNDKNGTYFSHESGIINFREGSSFILNYICNYFLTSYHTYKKAVRLMLDFKNNIPVYLAKEICFFATSSSQKYECIWINYQNIKNVKNKAAKIQIQFKNDETLVITKKNDFWIKLTQKIEKLERYYQKLKM